MTTEIDFQQLESLCWRALCRHQISEREMLVLATVVRLSFGIGRPCLRLDHAIDLARLTGMSKGSCAGVVERVERSRALEVFAGGGDRRLVYTFLPPSPAWPWLYLPRVDLVAADDLEGAILRGQLGPVQDDLLVPLSAQEWSGAQAIERLREELLAAHRTAANFPVMDRLPKPAPAPQGLSSGEGLSRPLESAVGGVNASAADVSTDPPGDPSAIGSVLESRTGSQIENHPLRALKASKGDITLKPLKALRDGFSNREPKAQTSLDPGASEEEIVAWLRTALGEATMKTFGGWWRLRIRESRYAAVNTCMELHMRLTSQDLKPLRNPGGWARDQYQKIRGEEAAQKA